MGIHQSKLRLFTAEGQLIPTPEEAAQQERQQKEQAEQQAEALRLQNEQAEQEVAEMESLLARYRERFGELPD